MAAHQAITHAWWENRRHQFDLTTSELVLEEAAKGDPQAAEKRLLHLADLPILAVPEDAIQLAPAIVRSTALPEKAYADAVHIATAAIHRTDYLLTWNCTHIANAELLPRVS